MEQNTHETKGITEQTRQDLEAAFAVMNSGVQIINCNGRWIKILTREEFGELPLGSVVVNIFSGYEFVIGQHDIDIKLRGATLDLGTYIELETARQLDVLFPQQ